MAQTEENKSDKKPSITLMNIRNIFAKSKQGNAEKDICAFLGKDIYQRLTSTTMVVDGNKTVCKLSTSSLSKIFNGTYTDSKYEEMSSFLSQHWDEDNTIKYIQAFWVNWINMNSARLKAIKDHAQFFVNDPALADSEDAYFNELANQLTNLTSLSARSDAAAVFLTVITLMAVTRGYWNKLDFYPLFKEISVEKGDFAENEEQKSEAQIICDNALADFKNEKYRTALSKLNQIIRLKGASHNEIGTANFFASEVYRCLLEKPITDSESKAKYQEKYREYLERAIELNNADALIHTARNHYEQFFRDRSQDDLDIFCKMYIKIIESESDNPSFKGEAYWRLYLATDRHGYDLPSGFTKENCLKRAYDYGYEDAVKEYINSNIISITHGVSISKQDINGICFVNEMNDIYDIIATTKPANLEMRLLDSGELALHVTEGASVFFLLVSNDFDRNLTDLLRCLQVVKEDKSICDRNIKFFLRGSQEKASNIVDAALNHMGDRTIPVHIIDEDKRSADVLARHPLFYPIRKLDFNDSCTLNYVIIGNTEGCKWLLREAYWMTTFRNLKIRTNIILIAPDAHRFFDEISFSCPQITVSAKKADRQASCFSDYPEIRTVELEYHSGRMIKEVKSILASGTTYFSIDIGSDSDNLAMAIRIREESIRSWIENGTPVSKIDGEKNLPVITFKCRNSDIACLSQSAIVINEDKGGAWYNNYAVIPFGSVVDIYSWDSLTDNILEELSLNVHLQYYFDTIPNNSDDEAAIRQQAMRDYYCRTYNRDSSMAVAMSMSYRICQFKYKDMQDLIPVDWDILDGNTFFSCAALTRFTEILNGRPLVQDKNKEEDKNGYYPSSNNDSLYQETLSMAEWEHERWNRYMISRGWSAAQINEVENFVRWGNTRHQLYAGRLHPCMIPYNKLKTLEKKLLEKTGLERNFCSNDIKNIQNTENLLRLKWTRGLKNDKKY